MTDIEDERREIRENTPLLSFSFDLTSYWDRFQRWWAERRRKARLKKYAKRLP